MAAADDEPLLRQVRYASQRSIADRDWLIMHYRGLAEALAVRMDRGGGLRDDLRQVATESLMRTVERFDPSRGVPFEAYAAPTINGALKRYFRDQVWALRVPRQVHDLVASRSEVTDRLTQRLGRSPTPQQVADELGVDVEGLLEADEALHARSTRSLDASPLLTDAASFAVDPIGAEIDRLALRDALAGLDARDREILELLFQSGQSQLQIAEHFGVSQMQISRWLARALARLRDRIVV